MRNLDTALVLKGTRTPDRTTTEVVHGDDATRQGSATRRDCPDLVAHRAGPLHWGLLSVVEASVGLVRNPVSNGFMRRTKQVPDFKPGSDGQVRGGPDLYCEPTPERRTCKRTSSTRVQVMCRVDEFQATHGRNRSAGLGARCP